MSFRNKKEVIEKYTKDILDYYYKSSRVQFLTTVKKVNEITEPKYIGHKIQLKPDLFEPNVYYEFSRLIQGMQMAEFQKIIDELNKKKNHYVKHNKLPNKEIIDSAIDKIDTYSNPDFMIVPIAFFTDMHKWGMPIESKYHILTYKNHHPQYDYLGNKILILWSNKFINLNNIIIGRKEDSEWQYIPDKQTNNRLTVRFQEDYTLFLQTIFKYIPPHPEEISIIEFPEELTRLEKS